MPHELNTNASLIQMTIGIMTFGIAIGQLIGGPLSDSLGEKTTHHWQYPLCNR